MDSSTRRTCPSCQTRLSPLAAECPECGLALAPPRLGRPFFFQASALAQASFETSAKALTAPALGRVAAVAVEISPEELERPSAEAPPSTLGSPRAALGFEEPVASFWPLVKVEATEALLRGVPEANVARSLFFISDAVQRFDVGAGKSRLEVQAPEPPQLRVTRDVVVPGEFRPAAQPTPKWITFSHVVHDTPARLHNASGHCSGIVQIRGGKPLPDHRRYVKRFM